MLGIVLQLLYLGSCFDMWVPLVYAGWLSSSELGFDNWHGETHSIWLR